MRDSIVHPFDIADPEIVCWIKEKYIVGLPNLNLKHRISHTVRKTCKGEEESFKAFRFSPDFCSYPITQHAFTVMAATSDAEHYSKEIYEARLAGGGSARTCRTHKNKQDKFGAYRLTTAYPFRRDAHHDAHRQATFQVVKSAYLKQLAHRESQAAKAEETKKD